MPTSRARSGSSSRSSSTSGSSSGSSAAGAAGSGSTGASFSFLRSESSRFQIGGVPGSGAGGDAASGRTSASGAARSGLRRNESSFFQIEVGLLVAHVSSRPRGGRSAVAPPPLGSRPRSRRARAGRRAGRGGWSSASAASLVITRRRTRSASDCSIVCIPRRGAGLHDRVDLLDLALADQVPDGVVRQQDLERGDAALAVRGRQQRLRDDALQRAGELDPDLLLLLGREDVDDAVDRRRARSACAACRRRGGRSRPRSARSRSSRGRASRRRGSRPGPGAARRGAPRAKLVASAPISRWLTMQRLWRCTNSIGSSIVRMWSVRLRLISSIIAASVVDLPEPVGPVTRTRPRGLHRQLVRGRSAGRAPRASSAPAGIRRKAAPSAPRWK